MIFAFFSGHLLLLYVRVGLNRRIFPFLPQAEVQGYFWKNTYVITSVAFMVPLQEGSECRPTVPFLKSLDLLCLEFKNFFRYGIQSTYYTKLPMEVVVGGSEPAPCNQIHSYFCGKMQEFSTTKTVKGLTPVQGKLCHERTLCVKCAKSFQFSGRFGF